MWALFAGSFQKQLTALLNLAHDLISRKLLVIEDDSILFSVNW